MNQSNSPLLKLPGELRNRIYTYILDSGVTWHITCHRDYAWRKVSRYHDDCECVLCGDPTIRAFGSTLHRVSRQIHQETWLLPYALNTFEADYYGGTSIDALVWWLHQLPGPARCAIRSLRLNEGHCGEITNDVLETRFPVWWTAGHPHRECRVMRMRGPVEGMRMVDGVDELYALLPGLERIHLLLNVSKFAVSWDKPDKVAIQRAKSMAIAQLRPEVERMFGRPEVGVSLDVHVLVGHG